jgi:hypothetical protein
MTVLESSAAGVPVVSTAVGRVGEAFLPGTDYRCIDPDDVMGAADAIEGVLRGDADKTESQIRHASERMHSDFSETGFVESMTRVYADVAQQAGLELALSKPAPKHEVRRTIKKWRASDRAYWAKELFVAGQRRRAIGMMLDAFRLDPLCEGIWRVPARKLGFKRDEK